MKATELRIGNIVQCNDDGTIFKIDEITAMGLTVTALGGGETTWIEFDQFEPITLTEKWLTDFGFKMQVNQMSPMAYWYFIGRFGIWYYTESDIPEYFGITLNRIDVFIKYVHQLQNLYFALTGTELHNTH